MAQPKKSVFLREATGLVREVSLLRATFFNMAGSVGNGAALSTAYVALFPIIITFGLPPFSWGLTIAAIFSVFYIVCLAVLNQIMPRSGGDYIYTSRITHPLLGFIEGWTFLWATAAAAGYNGWATVYNIGNLASAAVVFGPGFSSLGNTLTTQTSLTIIGILAFVLAGFIIVSRPRVMFRIVTVLSVLGVVSVFLLLIALINVSPSTFATNFQKYTGNTTSQVIQTAINNGFSPNTTLNPQLVGALLAFGLFAYIGFTNSAFLAGELKGNIARNTGISTLIALIFPLFTGAFYILPFFSTSGYRFVNAWGYLFWNAGSVAPLHTAPTTVVLATIGNPGLAPLSLFAGLFIDVVFNFLILLSWVPAATRILLAQSMDRVMPGKLADVHGRTNQPVYGVITWLIIGFFFYVLTVYGVSPASSLYYLVILGFFSLLFPGVNVILIKKRRPRLLEMAPRWARKEFLRIPFIAWMGILWLVFLLPVFGYVDLWGIVSSLLSTPGTAILSFTFTSGVLLTVILLVAAAIWYFAYKTYNMKKGIDLRLVFAEIPPE